MTDFDGLMEQAVKRINEEGSGVSLISFDRRINVFWGFVAMCKSATRLTTEIYPWFNHEMIEAGKEIVQLDDLFAFLQAHEDEIANLAKQLTETEPSIEEES